MKFETIFASAARAATPTAVEIDTAGYDYLALQLSCTLDAAAASVQVEIDYKDPLTGVYTTILAAAALASVSTQLLLVGPGIVAAANVSAQAILPDKIRITATHTDADAITYSVTAVLK